MVGYLVVKSIQGRPTMQFFLNLIWDYSCCQHLVALPPQEDEL